MNMSRVRLSTGSRRGGDLLCNLQGMRRRGLGIPLLLRNTGMRRIVGMLIADLSILRMARS
jgi:hypothetical protein